MINIIYWNEIEQMLYSEDIFETKEKKKKGERLSMKKIIEIRKFQYKRIVNKQTEKS